ncbi:MAG: hypothetical protein QXY32_01640 [Nitrososphaerota archaeon]
MDRLSRVKSRVLEIRTRAGLAAATPVIDRVQNILAQRAARGGILAGLRLAAPAAAPTAAPETQEYAAAQEYQLLPGEEAGIESR